MKLIKALRILCVVPVLSAYGQIYTYQLMPGSTVTPANGEMVTGPTEQLTGAFQLQVHELWPWWSELVFKCVSLDFVSDSYSFSLLDPNKGGFATSFDTNYPDWAALNVVVAATGLGIDSGEVHRDGPLEGWYAGPYDQPTQFVFSSLGFAPTNGGRWAARMTINAVLIPEPSPLVLLSLVLMAIPAFRCRTSPGTQRASDLARGSRNDSSVIE